MGCSRYMLSAVGLIFVMCAAITASPEGRPPERGRSNVQLPEGPGRLSVEGYCRDCQALLTIVNSGG